MSATSPNPHKATAPTKKSYARECDPSTELQGAILLSNALDDAGLPNWLVGGCVRDSLLGKTPKDYDLAVAADYSDIEAAVTKAGAAAFEVGAQFGILTVVFQGNQYELASLRKDGPYTDGRHPDWVKTGASVSLEEDASRRDFTCNALFQRPGTGEIVDFYSGVNDVESRLLRAVGNPTARIMEDSHRMMRAVRFAAQFGFSIEETTRTAIIENADRLGQVSRERIGQELIKMLKCNSPTTALRLLGDLDLSAIALPGTILRESDLARVQQLSGTSVECVLAGALLTQNNPRTVLGSLKLTNAQIKQVTQLIEATTDLDRFTTLSLSERSSLLSRPDIIELALLQDAQAITTNTNSALSTVLDELRLAVDYPHYQQPWADPIVTGDLLISHGQKPGATFKAKLNESYAAQLKGEIKDLNSASEWITNLT
jgi:poly(A) polymerase